MYRLLIYISFLFLSYSFAVDPLGVGYDCRMWLSAGNTNGLTNGFKMSYWRDTINNFSALAPSANYYVKYTNNAVSGNPAIRFDQADNDSDATGDRLRTSSKLIKNMGFTNNSSITNYSPFVLSMVLKHRKIRHSANGGIFATLEGYGANPAWKSGFYLRAVTNVAGSRISYGAFNLAQGSSYSYTPYGSITTNEWYILTLTYDGVGTSSVYINGVLGTTASRSIQLFAENYVYLGHDLGGAANQEFDGWMAEILWFKGDTNRLAVETYLQTKYFPVLNSFLPTSGAPGSSVVLSGTNFGNSQGNGKVYFGNTDAGVATLWSDTSITIKVPSGASTGAIKVVVDTAKSFSTAQYTVTAAPTPPILSITSPSGNSTNSAVFPLKGTTTGTIPYEPDNVFVYTSQISNHLTLPGDVLYLGSVSRTAYNSTGLSIDPRNFSQTGTWYFYAVATNSAGVGQGVRPLYIKVVSADPTGKKYDCKVWLSADNTNVANGTKLSVWKDPINNVAAISPSINYYVKYTNNMVLGKPSILLERSDLDTDVTGDQLRLSSATVKNLGFTNISSVTNYGPFTLSVVLKHRRITSTPAAGGAVYSTIEAYGTIPVYKAGFNVRSFTNSTGLGYLKYGAFDYNGGTYGYTPNGSIKNKEWYILTLTYDGAGTSSIYINGSLSATATKSILVSPENYLKLGADTAGGNTNNFDGWISEILWYRGATNRIDIENYLEKKYFPKVISFSPRSNYVGDNVTIIGSNFGTSQGSSSVKFGAISATDVVSWSDSSVIVKVPEGAQSGTLKIYRDDSPSLNNDTFTVLYSPQTPVISFITPVEGQSNSTVIIVKATCSGSVPYSPDSLSLYRSTQRSTFLPGDAQYLTSIPRTTIETTGYSLSISDWSIGTHHLYLCASNTEGGALTNVSVYISGNADPIGAGNCAVWLRADSGIITNGNKITKWLDQSLNGNNAQQNDNNCMPGLVNSNSGRIPFVRFDGDLTSTLSDKLSIANNTTLHIGTDPFTFVVLLKDVIDTENRSFLGICPRTATHGAVDMGLQEGLYKFATRENSVLNKNGELLFNTAYPGKWRVVIFTRNDKTVRGYEFTNHQLVNTSLSTGANLTSLNDMTIGMGRPEIKQFRGDMAEILFYKKELNSTERGQIVSYLRNKYFPIIQMVSTKGSNTYPITISGINFGNNRESVNGRVVFGSVSSVPSDILSWTSASIVVKVPVGAVIGTNLVYVEADDMQSEKKQIVITEPSILMAHWKLETNVLAAVGFDGVAIGTLNFSNSQIGNGSVFNGSDSGIHFSTFGSNLAPTKMSLSFWMKANFYSNQVLVEKYPNDFSGKGYSVQLKENGQMWFLVGSRGIESHSEVRSYNNYIPGVWQHVCVVYGDNNAKIFINGIQTGSSSISALHTINNNNYPLHIGMDSTGNLTRYTGMLKDLKIYSYCRTSQQIASEYHEIYEIFGPKISSITPSQAQSGTSIEVILNGANFGSTQGESKLVFCGSNIESSSIAEWTDSKIVLNLPTGIKSGKVYLIVKNIESNKDLSFIVMSGTSLVPTPLLRFKAEGYAMKNISTTAKDRDDVTIWNDIGRSNCMLQNISGYMPNFFAGRINSTPSIEFRRETKENLILSVEPMSERTITAVMYLSDRKESMLFSESTLSGALIINPELGVISIGDGSLSGGCSLLTDKIFILTTVFSSSGLSESYLNGEKVLSGFTPPAVFAGSWGVVAGDNSIGFEGGLCDLQIYDRALQMAEIFSSISNLAKEYFGPRTVSRFPEKNATAVSSKNIILEFGVAVDSTTLDGIEIKSGTGKISGKWSSETSTKHIFSAESYPNDEVITVHITTNLRGLDTFHSPAKNEIYTFTTGKTFVPDEKNTLILKDGERIFILKAGDEIKFQFTLTGEDKNIWFEIFDANGKKLLTIDNESDKLNKVDKTVSWDGNNSEGKSHLGLFYISMFVNGEKQSKGLFGTLVK